MTTQELYLALSSIIEDFDVVIGTRTPDGLLDAPRVALRARVANLIAETLRMLTPEERADVLVRRNSVPRFVSSVTRDDDDA